MTQNDYLGAGAMVLDLPAMEYDPKPPELPAVLMEPEPESEPMVRSIPTVVLNNAILGFMVRDDESVDVLPLPKMF